MSETVVSWCHYRSVDVSRSTAYKKNDQALLAGKAERSFAAWWGYGRFQSIDAARSLTRLFAAARLQLTSSSLKLKEKHRDGAKVIKRYPATAYERVGHPDLDKASKRRLQESCCTLDPVVLLAMMREAQNELGKRVGSASWNARDNGRATEIDLVAFARELGDGWKQDEQRRYVWDKPVPHRPSMIDAAFLDPGMARRGSAPMRSTRTHPAGSHADSACK